MPALPEEIENWLAAHHRVFTEIFAEFEMNNVVSIDRNVPFACNDCGRCCYTQDFGIFVYPVDIDRMAGAGAFLPLCCMLPEEDEEGHLAYAFPSKQEWGDLLNRLTQESPEDQEVAAAYQHVTTALARLNPDLYRADDSCIFYANSYSVHRCLIYHVRPTCCRVYPFDRFPISRLQVPPALAAQYKLLGDQVVGGDPALYCDLTCFTVMGKLKFKQIRKDILADKVNSIINASVAVEDDDEDLSLEMLLALHNRLDNANGSV